MHHSPLLEPHHRELFQAATDFARLHLRGRPEAKTSSTLDEAREITLQLGEAGWLAWCVPEPWGKAPASLDVRALVMVRAALAYESGLADTQFAVQGLGSFPLASHGDPELQREILPGVVKGTHLPAFALTEPEAGSDAASLGCTAVKDGNEYVLNGVKRFISNAGVAAGYSLFARTDPAAGSRGITAFWVPGGTKGLEILPLHPMAPHPLGELRLDGVRVPLGNRIGAEGQGFRIAMGTLNRFRTTVGGAALGLLSRALDEGVHRATSRRQFGSNLSEKQGISFPLAEMEMDRRASSALVLQAAWDADHGHADLPLSAATAKLFATEAAQRGVDRAVQTWGGEGVLHGSVVERLYREVRALRIYEGTSEIQKVVLSTALFRASAGQEGR